MSAVYRREDPDRPSRGRALGRITLNRPKALNALTLDMVRQMTGALAPGRTTPSVGAVLLDGAGERGLCAGGDIRALYESARSAGDAGRDVLARRIHARTR